MHVNVFSYHAILNHCQCRNRDISEDTVLHYGADCLVLCQTLPGISSLGIDFEQTTASVLTWIFSNDRRR